MRQTASETLRALEVLQSERGGYEPTVHGVGLVLIRFPDRDHQAVVHELEHWALAGSGQNRQIRDWTRTLATFLERSPSGSAPRSSAVRPRSGEMSELDRKRLESANRLMNREGAA